MDARESGKKSGVQMHLYLTAKSKTPIDSWCLQMISGSRWSQGITTEQPGGSQAAALGYTDLCPLPHSSRAHCHNREQSLARGGWLPSADGKRSGKDLS